MASLQNAQIDQSYQGLIKTANNQGGAPFPPAPLQYGDGTDTPIRIGDGTSVGVGDIVSLVSGTKAIEVNSQSIGITGLSSVDGAAGTVQYINGTFTYGAAFPGAPATNVDFTNATVTGLPGGATGLESGTGTDSMQSAASLTTNAADASGASAIALGDSATAPNEGDVNIGDGNTIASKTYFDGDVVIGRSNNSSTTNGGRNVLIGDNNTVSQNERCNLIGSENSASRGDHSILGYNNTTQTQYQIAVVGNSNTASGEKTFIGGHNSSATATGAVALGDGVTASTAQTVSVKSLETQTDGGVNIKGDGTNAGKLKLYCEDAAGTHNVTLEGPAHAGGQSYTLKLPNVQSAGSQILEADSSGNLSWINTPSGGGAAPAYGAYGGNGMRGVIARNNNPTDSYRTWITTTGYGVSGQIKDGAAQYAIIGLQAGDTIQEVQVGINTGVAGATMEVAFYDLDVDSNGTLYIKDRLLSLGSVDASSAGSKTITLGTPFTMPSGKVNSQVAVLCFPSATGVSVLNWSQPTWNGAGGDPAGTTVYRAMGLNVNPGVAQGATLPASIGAIGTTGVVYGSETNGALWLLYR